MANEPTNQEVANEIGIEEIQVEQYRRETLPLGDGAWLVHFSYDMPKALRHHFTGSFTAVIQARPSITDARQSD
ncbi:hypothetical protein ACJ70E_15285 [Pseudomonas plecoglossicida]|uniref:hypothetical protein n=1 Tax=Pseudomonas plecoglossicida TaxID=70775 RepID=UPI00397745F6